MRVNNPGNKSGQRVVQEKKPLGRLHRPMLLFSGERYFVQSIVIQDANDKEMQAQIRIVTQILCYLVAGLVDIESVPKELARDFRLSNLAIERIKFQELPEGSSLRLGISATESGSPPPAFRTLRDHAAALSYWS